MMHQIYAAQNISEHTIKHKTLLKIYDLFPLAEALEALLTFLIGNWFYQKSKETNYCNAKE